jgi:uncharacterized protein (TIGR02001 family)
MQGRWGAVRAVLAVAVLTTAMGLGASSANADDKLYGDKNYNETKGGGPQFSVNATYASDYRFRGFTQTQEKPALQGGFDVVWPNFYAGLWASSVDFGDVQDASGFHNSASVEMIGYAGFKRKFLGTEVDLGALYYFYPGSYGIYNYAKGAVKDLDFFEGMLGFKREIHSGLSLTSTIYYSPDYQGSVGQNWVFETGIERKFAAHYGITPTFSAMIGANEGQEKKGGLDYYYWNAGMSFVFADYFEFDIRYFDAFDVPTGGLTGITSCRNQCDGRVVARITFEN